MSLLKTNIAFGFVSAALATALTGCSLKPDTTVTLEIDIRGAGVQRAPGTEMLFGGPGLEVASLPSSASMFNCYAVNVYGLGIGAPWEQGPGFDINDPLKCRYPGVTSHVLSGSSTFTAEVMVPSGAKRVVQVLGLYRDDMTCPLAGSNFSDMFRYHDPLTSPEHVFQLGHAITDIFEDTTVSIDSEYSHSNADLAFGGCGYKKIQEIATGESHTCVLVEDEQVLTDFVMADFSSSGSVYCAGSNAFGQLGDGTTTNRLSPTRVMLNATTPLTNVVSIGAGSNHTCAIVRDFATYQDTLYCWGRNHLGQLGVGDQNNRYYATYVITPGGYMGNVDGGLAHTCFESSGNVQCMGDDSIGQMGDSATNTTCNGTTSCQLMPVIVPGAGGGRIAAGDDHTCVSGGTGVNCWGDGAFGELGQGTASVSDAPVAVTGLPGHYIQSISAGGMHTCVATNPNIDPMQPPSPGNVYCWGRNMNGQLGMGTLTDQSSASLVGALGSTAHQVTAGYQHTCAQTTSGLYCWGDNAYGQLGNSVTPYTSTPTLTLATTWMGSMGAGYAHTCTQFENEVRCWGNGASGQLANGSTSSSATPHSANFKFAH